MDTNEANANVSTPAQGGSPEAFQELSLNMQPSPLEAQGPAKPEATANSIQGGPTASVLPNVQHPTPVAAASSAPDDSAKTDDTPLAAADDEVIEQEWVQKAKQIVLRTKEDPFSQEKEISGLQSAYINKRYGKNVKLTDD